MLDEAWRTLGMEPTKDRRLVRAAFVSAVRLTHPDRNPHPDAHERTAALITAYHVAEQALRKDEVTAARLRRQAERASSRPASRPTRPDRSGRRPANGAATNGAGASGATVNGAATNGAGANGAAANGRSAAGPGVNGRSSEDHGTSARPQVVAPPAVRRLAADTVSIEAPSDEAFAFLKERLPQLGDVTLADPAAGLFQLVVQFLESPVCYLTFDLQGRAATGSTEVFLTIESIEARPAPDLGAVSQLVAEILS